MKVKKNIQLLTSKALIQFHERVKEKYKLTDYISTNIKTIFFGIYYEIDLLKIRNHKGYKILIFGGTDCKYEYEYFRNKIDRLKKIEINEIWAISDDLYERIIKHFPNEIVKKIDFNLVNKNLFYPRGRGNKIYLYDGYNKNNKSRYVVYRIDLLERLVNELSDYEYIWSSDLNLPYEKMPEIYKECFIGLRLTENDGNANTVQEFEAMNIPIIHNQSDYGLKWNNFNDIKKYIIYYNENKKFKSYYNYKFIFS